MLAARHFLLAAALVVLATTAGAAPEDGRGRWTGTGGVAVELLHLQVLEAGVTLGFQSGDQARVLNCAATGGTNAGSRLGPAFAVSSTPLAPLEFFSESEDGTGRSTGGGGSVTRVAVPLSTTHPPQTTNPVTVTTAVRHRLSPGEEVVIEGSGMSELNGRTFVIATSSFISPALSFRLVGENGTGRTTGVGGTVNIPNPTRVLSLDFPPTATNPVVVTTFSAHPYQNRDQVTIEGSGMSELNGRTFSVSVIDDFRFELFIDLENSSSYDMRNLPPPPPGQPQLVECVNSEINRDDRNVENFYGNPIYDAAFEVPLSSTVAPTTTRPVVVTTEVPHGFAPCAEIMLTGYFGSRMTEINRRPFFVVNPTETTFELYDTSCPIPSSATGTSVTRGVLSETDPIGADWGLGDENGPFVDAYEVTVEDGGTVVAMMESESVDSHLWLLDPTRSAVAEDDDGSGSNDAMLAVSDLDAGTYTLLAGSHDEGEVGPYTLTVVPEPAWAALQLAAATVVAGLARARRRMR